MLIDLSNDEAYYWTFAKQLQWNYLDHPSMIAIWIKLFSFNLIFEDNLLLLRLGSMVAGLISSFFIYKTISTLKNERAAYIGVALYNFSFYASIVAGVFIFPDMPQMVFWTASMYCIVLITKNQYNLWPWILFGVCSGLAFMSKIHTGFIWLGLCAYILFYSRATFKCLGLYVALLIFILIVSPIFFWNINNDFITFTYHGARVTVDSKNGINAIGFLKEVLSQIFINNPFTSLIIIYALTRKSSKSLKALTLFNLIGIPLILLLLFLSIFRTTLPHWSGPAYITLIPLAAIHLSQKSLVFFTSYIRIGIIATILSYMGLLIFINAYPGTIGDTSTTTLGKGDMSLDNYGWQEASEQFKPLYEAWQKKDAKKINLVCNQWWGAHIEYYFARPIGAKMIGLGPIIDIHQYHWRNKGDDLKSLIDTSYCIIPSNEYQNPAITYAPYYQKIDSIYTIHIKRNKLPVLNFFIYKLSGLKQKVTH